MSQEIQRIRWLIGCAIFLFLPSVLLYGAAERYRVSPIYPLLILALYMVLTSILVATISGMLYAQHRFEKNRVGLAVLLLITLALSLPLGFANLFWFAYDLSSHETEQLARDEIILNFTIGLGVLYIPAFFLADTAVALLLHWRKGRAR